MQPPAPAASPFQAYGDYVLREEVLDCLRRNQRDALEATAAFFAEPANRTKPAIIVMPTGTGKSGVIACLPYRLRALKVLILTPSNEIRRQIAKDWAEDGNDFPSSFLVRARLLSEDEAERYLPTCKVVEKAAHLNRAVLKHPVLITNAHKFSPRCTHQGNWTGFLTSERYDLVIVDEAHHLPSDTWTRVTQHFSQSKLVFLTATPKRADNTRITEEVDEGGYAYVYTRLQAVNDHVIRDVEWHELPSEKGRDPYVAIAEAVRDSLADKDTRLPLPANTGGHRALLIASDVEHANDLGTVCAGAGLQVSIYHTSTKKYKLSPAKAAQRKKDFEAGRTKAMIVVQQLLEGYDFPPISVLGIATKIGSSVKFQQFIGRGLRVTSAAEPPAIKATVISHSTFAQGGLMANYRNEQAAVAQGEEVEEGRDNEGEEEEVEE